MALFCVIVTLKASQFEFNYVKLVEARCILFVTTNVVQRILFLVMYMDVTWRYWRGCLEQKHQRKAFLPKGDNLTVSVLE